MDRLGFAHRHVHPVFTRGQVPIDHRHLVLEREHKCKPDLVNVTRRRVVVFDIFAADQIGVPFRHLADTGEKTRADEQHLWYIDLFPY